MLKHTSNRKILRLNNGNFFPLLSRRHKKEPQTVDIHCMYGAKDCGDTFVLPF